MTTRPNTSESLQSIAAELEALGEDPMVAAESDEVMADIDVVTVGTLVAIATTEPSTLPGLSPLSQRRVWKQLQGRVAAAAFAPAHDVDPHEAAANASGGWRAVVAGLAVAAGVIFVPRLAVPEAPLAPLAEASDGAELGPSARALLDSLGDSGTARARSMAEGYERRMRTEGGHAQ
jgi:hypothetical protein